VLLCTVTAQVEPSPEIGRITVQVPLLTNGKPVVTKDEELLEVARVVEINTGKGTSEEVVVPTVKVRNTRAIVESVNKGMPNPGMPNRGIPNPGMPNPGIPNPGMPNRGIPNPGMPNRGIPNPGMPNRGIPNPGLPNRGIPNPGMPNPGIPNPGMPNRGIPNPGMPNPGIPNPGMPNRGIPNPGMPNRGIPNPAASELQPVAALPPSTTTAPVELPKSSSSKNCHQLLLGGIGLTVPPTIKPIPPQFEGCDQLCTKFELNPICAYNGICIHEFPNQCVMDTFNCKHRGVSFQAVDEDVCSSHLCARRCREDELEI
ncbi:hypothetical protein KR222_004365, partial [Zaprionus bogoriensis]